MARFFRYLKVVVLFCALPLFCLSALASPGQKRDIGLSLFDAKTTSCCGGAEDTEFSPMSAPEYETYKLSATYFTLRENLTVTLMLNNKGPQPILAMPTIYSLSGTRLTLAPITVPAASYIDVDMYELLAGADEQFREGSMKISYNGISQQLGAQVKMIDAAHGLIWAEQFTYTTKYVSSRLETLWWLPFENSTTRVVVSNTSSGTVAATIAVDGTSPKQQSPVQLSLAPWETRVLDIMDDFVAHGSGHVHDKGGISITHTGAPGAVLARMFIAKPNKGYSAANGFIDPEAAASQRWHGNGLRFRNLNGSKLLPVLTARNTGDQPSNISGRIIYTGPDGEVGTINISPKNINSGKTRVFELASLIDDLPASVTYGGIELEYDTPKGSVITSLQSVSNNGQHVFQVPMFDPEKMPSSAGGFPWKTDGDFTTVVYIKNETDIEHRFAIHLRYPQGGGYSAGMKKIKPGQTLAFDFREMRDNQTPDSLGNLIPLDLEHGQISWGIHGAENKVLSGRSEQISVANGIASTYSCANCCPPSVRDVEVDPPGAVIIYEDVIFFSATQTDWDCQNQQSVPYASDGVDWQSYQQNIATIGSIGDALGVGIGATTIEGCITRTMWFNWGHGYCEPFTDIICDTESAEVAAPQVTFSEIGSVEKGGRKTLTATLSNRGNNQITLFLRKSNNQSTSGITFDDGSASKALPNSNGTHNVTIKGITESGELNDYKIEARYGVSNIYLVGTKQFTVSTVIFGESAACSGFDDNYLLVPKNGSNIVKAYFSPSGATGSFKLEVPTPPANGVTVSPTTVSTNNTEITVSGGNTVGNFKINVLANQQNSTLANELNVYVRNRIDKTLIFYAVTEDGNPDTPPPTSNVPTAAGLQTFLNNTWGKQANVYFTVTKGTDFEVDYDVNGDGKIGSQSPGDEPLAILNAQYDTSKNFNVYFLGLGVKTLPNGTTPAAFTSISTSENYFATFVSHVYNGTRDYITAHETGHLLGVSGQSTDNTFLMFEADLAASPCKIGKREWDIVHP